MNPAAPSRNLHHTRTYYDYTEAERYEEWKRDMAEAAYFAHVEGITHNYPPVEETVIILGNEPIDWESPPPF